MSDRVQRAREEIGRRRALAQAATRSPEGWRTGRKVHRTLYDGDVLIGYLDLRTDAAHIAANDPAHVLAVLDAAESVLDRHAQTSAVGLAYGAWCPADGDDYPCHDLRAVLDLYAPEATP